MLDKDSKKELDARLSKTLTLLVKEGELHLNEDVG